jgi:hypothetical protein
MFWRARELRINRTESPLNLTTYVGRYMDSVGRGTWGPQLYGLWFGIFRSRDASARAARKSTRPQNVTYVSGMFCSGESREAQKSRTAFDWGISRTISFGPAAKGSHLRTPKSSIRVYCPITLNRVKTKGNPSAFRGPGPSATSKCR